MKKRVATLLLLGALAGCGAMPMSGPAEPGEPHSLSGMSGTWYEIARFPNRAQDGRNPCEGATIRYSPQLDGTLQVTTACLDPRDGREVTAQDVARPVPAGEARLTLNWPVAGEYQVVAHDRSYRWMVIGSAQRDMLWLLARRQVLAAGPYTEAVARAREAGFDILRLRPTPQLPSEIGRRRGPEPALSREAAGRTPG